MDVRFELNGTRVRLRRRKSTPAPINIADHGLAFERAAEVSFDPLFFTLPKSYIGEGFAAVRRCGARS